MASRPFQISAWGVNPRFQALSSSAPTSSGSLAEALTDSAMAVDFSIQQMLVRLLELLLSSDNSGSENNIYRKQMSQKTTLELS